jgi:hypothetical protein
LDPSKLNPPKVEMQNFIQQIGYIKLDLPKVDPPDLYQLKVDPPNWIHQEPAKIGEIA